MPEISDFVNEALEGDANSAVEVDIDTTPSPERPVTGLKCEAKRLYEKPNRYGSEWVDTIPDHFVDPALDGDAWAEYAVLLRTHMVNGQQKLHSVVIQSPPLKRALKRLLAGYPGFSQAKPELEIEAPFKALVHHWDAFVAACDKDDDSDTTRHLRLLRTSLEPELQPSFDIIRTFKTQGIVDFDGLWAVFPPETIVYTAADAEGAERAYRLIRTEERAVSQAKSKFFFLHCSFVDFDGKKFGNSLHMDAIVHFEGSMRLKDLPVYPIESHPDKQAVVQRLVARGRKFEAHAGIHYRAYDGMANCESVWWTKQRVNGRIVIDATSYFKFNSYTQPYLNALDKVKELTEEEVEEERRQNEGTYVHEIMYSNLHQQRYDAMNSALVRKPDEQAIELTDEHRMLCTNIVHGYSLKVKKWLDFDIDDVKDIKWNSAAFNSLELPNDYKGTLLAFSKNQRLKVTNFDDVIEGKGRGMVVLLEGPPGTGKTLTVESVAEEMQAPLYAISAGQMDSNPSTIQKELLDAFHLAETWGAIILLDEADIFLERRSVKDLDRNRLVSIFLQTLEYYEGTIFLTTNRVEAIDPAFESRIHISLSYPELSPDSRRKVWKNFVSMVDVDTSDITEDTLDRLAYYNLNGRQIKNAVKMACLLAADDGNQLKSSHIESIIRILKSQVRKLQL